MSFFDVSTVYVSDSIKEFKNKLNVYDDDSMKIEEEIDKLNDILFGRMNELIEKFDGMKVTSKELFNLEMLSLFIAEYETLEFGKEMDLNRFSNVLNKTKDRLTELNEQLRVLEVSVTEEMKELIKAKTQTKHSVEKNEGDKDHETKYSFTFLITQCDLQQKCIGCHNLITRNSPYLRHMEIYPNGTENLKLYFYHANKECLVMRGFQEEYLRNSKVINGNEMNANSVLTIEHMGFMSQNIHEQDDPWDSDDGSEGSEISSKHSEACPDTKPMIRFFYKRKDARGHQPKDIICVACHEAIVTGSYLTTANQSFTVHIKRKCVEANGDVDVDFSRSRVFVYKLLQSHDELRQLLACGFYYNKIVGFKPHAAVAKGSLGFVASRTPKPDQSKVCSFFYRRKDPAQKPIIICVTCKKPIHPANYLTRGDSHKEPIHLKKNCISCDDMSQVKCFVYKLLRSHNDLKKLISCGFYSNNIIGVRPRNPDLQAELPVTPPHQDPETKLPPSKDVDFIFNEEPFICEVVLPREKCQGCGQITRKNEIVLRHKERVPREKLPSTPLISQFYHLMPTCLEKRGFTDKYLGGATCYIILLDTGDHQKVQEMLVKCGLSRNNFKYGAACVSQNDDSIPPTMLGDKEGTKYLWVVMCTKENGHCEGCGFDIGVNEACFVYGESDVQNRTAIYYHLSQWCLRLKFTEREISDITCVNNNSLANVSTDQIKECGITSITERLMHRVSKPLASNPFKARSEATRFVVDVSMDNRVLCCVCKQPLQLDKYVLAIVPAAGGPSKQLHLDRECVSKTGFTVAELGRSEVTLAVGVSRRGEEILRQCGFRNIVPGRG